MQKRRSHARPAATPPIHERGGTPDGSTLHGSSTFFDAQGMAVKTTELGPRSKPASAPPASAAIPGTLIASRYRLRTRIGAGSFGEVWIAEDAILRTNVALKWLHKLSLGWPERFRREVATLRLLRLPGVVRLIDEGEHGGRPFLVTDLVEGSPFPGKTGRSASGARSWASVRRPAASLLAILAQVHATGVIHLDLKPENVLVGAHGSATILDFGVAGGGLAIDRVERFAGAAGTPTHMAPEQILGAPVDARADLYAVGVMIFEALSGRAPHDHDDARALLAAKIKTPAPSLRTVAPRAPRPVIDLVDQLLAIDPNDRPASASDALDRLDGDARSPLGVLTAIRDEREPMSDAALRALFAGPDRLFHLREDAARLLLRKTEGIPSRVEAQIRAWMQLGLARSSPDGIAMDRAAIAAITDRGAGDGPMDALLARGDLRGAVHASLAAGQRHLAAGEVQKAASILAEGLWILRDPSIQPMPPDVERALLTETVKAALADGAPHALDGALYALSRRAHPSDALADLEILLSATIHALGAAGDRGHALASSLRPQQDPELERRRHRVRALAAAAAGDSAALTKVVADVEAWAEARPSQTSRLAASECRARLFYQQGRYEEAAAEHLSAAARDPIGAQRAVALTNAASAMLHVFRLDEALSLAAESAAIAAASRNPYWEGRAAWLERTARYRRGDDLVPDEPLLDAVRLVGVAALEALVHLTEAAIAFRTRDLRAIAWAEHARRSWERLNRPWLPTLARSLAIAAGARTSGREMKALIDRAASCTVQGMGLEMLGMLAMRAARDPVPAIPLHAWRAAAVAVVPSTADARIELRGDVLSTCEAIDALRTLGAVEAPWACEAAGRVLA